MSHRVQPSFDYSCLPSTALQRIESATRRLHELERGTAETIIEMGTHLIEVKATLPHGQFGPWLDAEFGWSNRTAQNFIRVATAFGEKSETVSHLGATTLYALAAESTPKAIRTEFTTLAATGQRVTRAAVEHAIAAHSATPKAPMLPLAAVTADVAPRDIAKQAEKEMSDAQRQRMEEMVKPLTRLTENLCHTYDIDEIDMLIDLLIAWRKQEKAAPGYRAESEG